MVTYAATNHSTGSTAVWLTWNTYGHCANSATITSTSNDPWPSWCTTGWCTGTSNTIVTASAWAYWQHQQHTQSYPAYVAPPATPEQIAEREAWRAREAARHDAERAARLQADRKAETLLLQSLSAEQAADYHRTGAFTVRLPDGRRYRIKKGWAGNVERLDDLPLVLERDGGEIAAAANAPVPVERLCIHPEAWTPDCDNMLAQKLLLEANEAEFRRIANITRLRAG